MNNLPTDIRDVTAQDIEAAHTLRETQTKRIGSMMERLTAPRGA